MRLITVSVTIVKGRAEEKSMMTSLLQLLQAVRAVMEEEVWGGIRDLVGLMSAVTAKQIVEEVLRGS
ncbi:hypothetical protein CLOM_g17039 [Closterium sp. NIES-68]|nr:hypothetical protein CLOM_g17039 [Closterium sp. NIES-68]